MIRRFGPLVFASLLVLGAAPWLWRAIKENMIAAGVEPGFAEFIGAGQTLGVCIAVVIYVVNRELDRQ